MQTKTQIRSELGTWARVNEARSAVADIFAEQTSKRYAKGTDAFYDLLARLLDAQAAHREALSAANSR